jgi:diguanylate cyclase (GGDEF)-like protein
MPAVDQIVVRALAGTVMFIAGTMLLAWIAGFGVAARTDSLAPMSPPACVGYLAAGAGLLAMGARPAGRRIPLVAGSVAFLTGAVGLGDALLSPARSTLFGFDARISLLTEAALMLLGAAEALDSRGWRVTRWLSLGAAAIGGAALIGFLLGIPLFYGPSRSIEMSWQAALCAVAVAAGIGVAHPSSAAARLLADRGMGGRFARRALPAVLGIPVVTGALCMWAARVGWLEYSVAAWVMTLTAVAGLAAVAGMAVTELEREERKLTDLAIRDPLTGAYNRRHFMGQAQDAAARSQRYGESAAIAVVDLDNFKELNDTWGHAAGDEALLRVHRTLRSRLRSSDVLGRIGGDEFAALILHVDESAALRVAAEMREAVAIVGRELAAEGRANRLGASVGVAPLHTDDPRDVAALIDLADQRMYLDKRTKPARYPSRSSAAPMTDSASI